MTALKIKAKELCRWELVSIGEAVVRAADLAEVCRVFSNSGNCKRYKNKVLAGAGTVISPEQATACLDAGAEFLVSPGLIMRATRIADKFGTTHHPRRADSARGAGGLPPESHTHQAPSLVMLCIALRCFRFGVPILGR